MLRRQRNRMSRRPHNECVTLCRLYELLSYDKDTGIFVWRKRIANKLAGTRAGYEDNIRGYRYINIDRKRYYEHRLAWFYVTGAWPPDEIDHEKGITNDNRFEKLREATSSNNKCNRRVKSSSSSGLKGVTQDKRRGTWEFGVYINGISHRKSGFATAEEAHAAYLEMAQKLHGEFMLSR